MWFYNWQLRRDRRWWKLKTDIHLKNGNIYLLIKNNMITSILLIVIIILLLSLLLIMNKINYTLIDNNDNLLEIINKLELIRNNTYISASDTNSFKQYKNNENKQ